MRGVQPVGPRLDEAGEETTGHDLLAVREKPLQQNALVHHLDAAHGQAQRTGLPGWLRLLLQHEHVHAVQLQLAASINPVGPPPEMITSNMNRPFTEVACRPAAPRGPAAHTRKHTYFTNP